VADDGPEVVGLVGRDRLGRGHGEGVGVDGKGLIAPAVDHAHHEHGRRPAVVPLVDGSHPPGADDPKHPRVNEHADVVRNGALRAVQGTGELGHRGRALDEQVEDLRSGSAIARSWAVVVSSILSTRS